MEIVEHKLRANIGVWGIKAGQFRDMPSLLSAVSTMFDIPNTGDAVSMCEAIYSMTKAERRNLAYKNLKKVEAMAAAQPERPSFASKPVKTERDLFSADSLQRMMDASQPQIIDGDLDIDPAKLLRKVVSAVISAGHASDLYEFPDVLAFFGARIPPTDTSAPNPSAAGRLI